MGGGGNQRGACELRCGHPELSWRGRRGLILCAPAFWSGQSKAPAWLPETGACPKARRYVQRGEWRFNILNGQIQYGTSAVEGEQVVPKFGHASPQPDTAPRTGS